MEIKIDLADSSGGVGRYPAAVRLLREATPKMEKGAAQEPRKMYNVACFHAMIAKYLQASGKGNDVIREADAESQKAAQWLGKAVDTGFFEMQMIKTDKDLDALRGREDFKKLLAELEAKAAGKK
jgi:hypothetical protein